MPAEVSPSVAVVRNTLAIMRLLRPRQWLKNVLLWVPAITSHQLLGGSVLSDLAWGMLAFCCIASCVYVCNDLLDIEADRQHPVKRRRPLASGAVSIRTAWILAPLLLVAGFGVATSRLPLHFTQLLAVYFGISMVYSTWWKRLAMLDVVVLACLYTLRILAGGAATGIVVSDWLMAFSVFLFSSLALAKRYVEMRRVRQQGEREAPRRGYRADDLELLGTLGPTSGYLAVLILALYVHSQEMRALYASRWPLWLICLVLMYWVGRLWLLARRGELDDDPVVFATTDRSSLMAGAIVAGLLMAAIWQVG